MRYGPEITWRIHEELLKTPNIRYVCKKVGIDHSTIYRWMSKHHSFYQMVTGALAMGRDLMNDAAESVIIAGIQRGEHKSATYWLAHNSHKYSNAEQAYYLKQVNENYIKVLKERRPDNSESTFETFFDLYYEAEKVLDPEFVRKQIDKSVKVFCEGDTQLEEIFYAAYAEWKKFKDDSLKKRKAIEPEEE